MAKRQRSTRLPCPRAARCRSIRARPIWRRSASRCRTESWRATSAEAKQIASRIGYPVALKAQAAALAHKSDAGGVALNITDEAALEAAWTRMHDVSRPRSPSELDGVLVEAMAKPGIEMIVGARRDPEWGPIVVIGLGGIWTEALGDVRLMPADISARSRSMPRSGDSRARACSPACAARRQAISERWPTWR